jgi:glycosyltransferase involved in cell wall biosynthesis
MNPVSPPYTRNQLVRSLAHDAARPGLSPSDRVPLTVLIGAKNEEKNIVACLRSAARADQLLVVDSRSLDRTRELAEREGAEVYDFDYDGGWPKKRNWALQNLPIRNEWVLILDADERISPELMDEIAESIRTTKLDGFYVRWKFIFLGRWMKHCWNHGWMPRLFRHGMAEYEDLGMRGEGGWDAEVHENVVIRGRSGRLHHMLDHESQQDLSFWIKKQNEFSDWRARRTINQWQEPLPPLRLLLSGDPVRIRKWLKAIYLHLPMKATLMFLWLYFCKRGFLDGVPGYYFCRLRGMHELNVCAKIYEMNHAPQQAVPQPHVELAKPVREHSTV